MNSYSLKLIRNMGIFCAAVGCNNRQEKCPHLLFYSLPAENRRRERCIAAESQTAVPISYQVLVTLMTSSLVHHTRRLNSSIFGRRLLAFKYTKWKPRLLKQLKSSPDVDWGGHSDQG
ncbi:uncharacterized protein LOC143040885 [Oratosquilla oratoria]|uniref:uncharacterized protein LOC143040885 n=1 Tax=Oratosquilla oratoria TaxID=337810 RepID=UPI003F7657A9